MLKTQGKYYFIDNGLKNIIDGMSSYDTGSSLENLIYIELIRRGYEVYIGQYNDIEIDFIAIKPNEKIYYQVSRSIMDENVFFEKFIKKPFYEQYLPKKFEEVTKEFLIKENGKKDFMNVVVMIVAFI